MFLKFVIAVFVSLWAGGSVFAAPPDGLLSSYTFQLSSDAGVADRVLVWDDGIASYASDGDPPLQMFDQSGGYFQLVNLNTYDKLADVNLGVTPIDVIDAGNDGFSVSLPPSVPDPSTGGFAFFLSALPVLLRRRSRLLPGLLSSWQ